MNKRPRSLPGSTGPSLTDIFQSLTILGLVILSFTVAALPALAETLHPTRELNFQEVAQQLLSQIQQFGATGIIVFIGLYAIATVAFIPGSLITLGAGVVYGVVQGSIYVLIGASLGAVLAFLVGRYLAREWVTKKIQKNSKFRAIDEAVSREGFKIVLLTRLSPIFPFNLLNYAFGITGVSLRDYTLGCIGMLPGTVLYVYIGSLAGSLARLGTEPQSVDPTLYWTIRGIGFLATIAVTVYVARIARQALSENISNAKKPNELPNGT